MHKQSTTTTQYCQPRYLVMHHGPNRHDRRARKHQDRYLVPESWWKIVNQTLRKVAR